MESDWDDSSSKVCDESQYQQQNTSSNREEGMEAKNSLAMSETPHAECKGLQRDSQIVTDQDPPSSYKSLPVQVMGSLSKPQQQPQQQQQASMTGPLEITSPPMGESTPAASTPQRAALVLTSPKTPLSSTGSSSSQKPSSVSKPKRGVGQGSSSKSKETVATRTRAQTKSKPVSQVLQPLILPVLMLQMLPCILGIKKN